MSDDEIAKLRVQVLLQESAQLHDNIQRNLAEMYRLPGLAFPVLTGAFVLAYEGKLTANLDQGLLSALFAVLAALIVIGFDNVWMQLCTFTEYKYAQVLPRLYATAGRDGQNYGQYTARGGIVRAMGGVVIVQAILLLTAIVAGLNASGAFRYVACAALALAAAATMVSWAVAVSMVRTIQRSVPKC